MASHCLSQHQHLSLMGMFWIWSFYDVINRARFCLEYYWCFLFYYIFSFILHVSCIGLGYLDIFIYFLLSGCSSFFVSVLMGLSRTHLHTKYRKPCLSLLMLTLIICYSILAISPSIGNSARQCILKHSSVVHI